MTIMYVYMYIRQDTDCKNQKYYARTVHTYLCTQACNTRT